MEAEFYIRSHLPSYFSAEAEAAAAAATARTSQISTKIEGLIVCWIQIEASN